MTWLGDRFFTQCHQPNPTRPGSLTSPERAIAHALAPTRISYKHFDRSTIWILHATLSRGSQLIKGGSRLATDNWPLPTNVWPERAIIFSKPQRVIALALAPSRSKLLTLESYQPILYCVLRVINSIHKKTKPNKCREERNFLPSLHFSLHSYCKAASYFAFGAYASTPKCWSVLGSHTGSAVINIAKATRKKTLVTNFWTKHPSDVCRLYKQSFS